MTLKHIYINTKGIVPGNIFEIIRDPPIQTFIHNQSKLIKYAAAKHYYKSLMKYSSSN